MTERINQQTRISTEEVLRTEIIVNQALIDILITKQIISERVGGQHSKHKAGATKIAQ